MPVEIFLLVWCTLESNEYSVRSQRRTPNQAGRADQPPASIYMTSLTPAFSLQTLVLSSPAATWWRHRCVAGSLSSPVTVLCAALVILSLGSSGHLKLIALRPPYIDAVHEFFSQGIFLSRQHGLRSFPFHDRIKRQ